MRLILKFLAVQYWSLLEMPKTPGDVYNKKVRPLVPNVLLCFYPLDLRFDNLVGKKI